MEITKTYMNYSILEHQFYDIFQKRFYAAIIRENLSRGLNEKPVKNTKTSTKISQYIYETNTKTIFVRTSNYFFEELLDIIREISKNELEKNITGEMLIEKLYVNKKVRTLFANWDFYSWTKTKELFHDQLIEEGFFYFDDLENQYYFNLFRMIKEHKDYKEKKEFIGGILHALTRHFTDFNKFNPKPNGDKKFQYHSFMRNIISCSLNGQIIKDRKDRGNSNYEINKEIIIDNNKWRVGLYWENAKKLFFLNTVIVEKFGKKKLN